MGALLGALLALAVELLVAERPAVAARRARVKTLLYEESIRVPLMALGPDLPRGASRDQVVANIDLAPTIYDVTGVEPGRDPDGISLTPLARSPKYSAEREILIQNQRSQGVRAPGWVYLEHERDDGAGEDCR